MLRKFMTLVLVVMFNACYAAAVQRPEAVTHINCRKPGVSYDLQFANLPVCAARTAPPVATSRGPASVQPSFGSRRVTFDSYIRDNALNPAIAGRRAPPQEAFKDYSKPAVISGSTIDGDGITDSLKDSATDANKASALAPGAVGTSPSTTAPNTTPNATPVLAPSSSGSPSSSGFNH